MLRQRINEAELYKSVLSTRFTESKTAFPDESKPTLESISDEFRKTDIKIAKLQDIQARYNVYVTVTVQGETFSLREAVSRLGGAGRLESMWRSVAAPQKDRYAMRENTRDASVVVATPTMSSEDSLKHATKALRYASDLRSAIAFANNTPVCTSHLLGATAENWLFD